MTQVPTSPGAMPIASEPPAPLPSAAPALIGAPSAEPAPVAPEYVQVPTEQLAPWGGRFGETIREARLYQQAQETGVFSAYEQSQRLAPLAQRYGYQSVDAMLDAMGEGPAADPGTTDPTITEPQVNPGLTREEMRAEMQSVLREEKAAETRNSGIQSERDFVTTTLKERGLLDESGESKGGRGRIARAALDAAINEAIDAQVPEFVTGKQRDEMLQQARGNPANAAVLEQAKKQFGTWMDEFKAENVSAFATGQATTPDTTVQGGAAGSAPAPDFEKQSKPEQRDRIMNNPAFAHLDEPGA